MKRPQLNFIVDAASFVAFLMLLTTGIVLRFQLPPGSGGIDAHSGGRDSGNRLITLLFGQSRHEWGTIHFWIAIVLIALLALHVVLHWRWIVFIVRGKQQQGSGWRFGLGIASLVALVVVALIPMAAPTDQVSRQQLRDQAGESEPADLSESRWLRGSMTLAEVAAESRIPVDELRDELGLPQDAPADIQIGPLLRDSGKHMSDLRRLLARQSASAAPNEKETRP